MKRKGELITRLFISLNFDDRTKDALMKVSDSLRAAAKRGNFSSRENLHLTLAFLGEISQDRLAGILKAIELTHFPFLELKFERLGRFFREDGELWWIGLAENPELLKLQRELCANLRTAGFELEARKFKPHITLARQLSLPKGFERASALPDPIYTCVGRISLMLSAYRSGELSYTELFGKNSDDKRVDGK